MKIKIEKLEQSRVPGEGSPMDMGTVGLWWKALM